MFLKTTLRLRAHRYLCACFLMSVFALTNRFLQAGTFRSQTTVPGKKRFCVGCTICIGCCGNVARRRRVFFQFQVILHRENTFSFTQNVQKLKIFLAPTGARLPPSPSLISPRNPPAHRLFPRGTLTTPPPYRGPPIFSGVTSPRKLRSYGVGGVSKSYLIKRKNSRIVFD